MKLLELTLTEKEINFLEACGFDMVNGYISNDVDYYKKREPELYCKYVTNW